jgi:hypothetical protein
MDQPDQRDQGTTMRFFPISVRFICNPTIADAIAGRYGDGRHTWFPAGNTIARFEVHLIDE